MSGRDDKKPVFVQYGCGFSGPTQWRNFDASPTLRFERIPLIGRLYTRNARRFPDTVEYGDILAGLPIGEGTCMGVYCSHILEHLALDDMRLALRNTYRVLKKGGCYRMVLPDLEFYARRYLNIRSPEAASAFMRDTYLGVTHRERGWANLIMGRLGNSKHLWMWDYEGLAAELSTAGFERIRRAEFNDSSRPEFAAVEDEGRWVDQLGIECWKPETVGGPEAQN
jgi:SAM-dependent methyltransferase